MCGSRFHSTPLLTDSEAGSVTWLLWLLLQSTLTCKCLSDMLPWSPLGRCPGVVSLSHTVDLLLVRLGSSKLIPIVARLYLPSYQPYIGVSFCSNLCQHLLLFVFLVPAILTRVKGSGDGETPQGGTRVPWFFVFHLEKSVL